MKTLDSKLEQLKHDLFNDITNRIRVFEAETGLTVADVELVFLDVSTLGCSNQHLLNEINVTTGE